MRALVTGGCGFIGTNLIKRLSNNNHKEYCENIVVSIDDYSTGSGDNEIECNGVQYFGGDISKVTDYSNIIDDCDIIFHLAAKARIQPSFETPTEYFQSNAAGTQNILEWARKNGNIPVVYAGSSSKHGDIYSNPYTFTKWQGEQLCEMYSKLYNLPVTICRFYNVYGPHQLTEGEYCTVIGIFESLYKKDSSYDMIIPITYNLKKPIKNKGSAIFLHCTENYKPTAGCIALKKKDFFFNVEFN